MGAVFRAKDLGRDYKKIVENAVKDLSPDTKDNNTLSDRASDLSIEMNSMT